ncbi:MAG: membrane protein insertase YidC [Thermotogae bacterium]|nr:membrane protein insertase YidC [Thermotogota bacterium]
MNDRTTRLLLFFLFAMGFMFVWDYVFVRPKREALRRKQSQVQTSKPKPKPQPKAEKTGTRKPARLIPITLNGYTYNVVPEDGSVFSLKDEKHKAEPSGYIVKPLRVRGEVKVDIQRREVVGKNFSYRFEEPFTIRFKVKEGKPLQLRTPLTEHGRYLRSDLFLKSKGGQFHKIRYKDANTKFVGDSLVWFGLRSRYYLVAVVGFKGKVVSFKEGHGITLRLYPSRDQEVRIFFGPAEREVLTAYDPPLKEAFDLGGGWLGWMVWPIYWALVLFSKITHHYGLAIILLALVLKILLSPLYVNMYRSAKQMQKLQPKLKKIQELYKDDPERLQWETMKLYREAGVNPLSGCLPMILMLPVFWALYQVLQNAIELKGTSFLWVQDLSLKDPYYALPIIMGLVSAANAWFQPSADPNTKRTSILMSAVFVFIFLNLPAGIVLYWLAYSLFGLIEQRIYRYVLKI